MYQEASTRVAEKRPVTAFCTPICELGMLVGASKNGTAVSLHAEAAASRPMAAAAAIGRCRVRPEVGRGAAPGTVLCVALMSEPQIEGEEIAARGWVGRDLDAAPDVLAADRADFRIESVISLAVGVQEVAADERQARTRDPAAGDPVEPLVGEHVAHRH